MNNAHYWSQRNLNATRAKHHYFKMENTFYDEIAKSINRTNEYIASPIKGIDLTKLSDDTPQLNINFWNITSDRCAYLIRTDRENDNRDKRITVLNFASYKNPGGMFLNGSFAQEESLCHKSTLYNVLKEYQGSYYEHHRRSLNRSLYTNDALYSPDIVFQTETKSGVTIFYKVDVITCAAPNVKAAKKYHNVSDAECLETLVDRIAFVLDVARANDVDILIAGAFGCGVFGNKLEDVATAFAIMITNYYHHFFDEIVFPIPNMFVSDISFKIFKDTFFNIIKEINIERRGGVSNNYQYLKIKNAINNAHNKK